MKDGSAFWRFSNQLLSDSWVVGLWRAGHVRIEIGLEFGTAILVVSVS
jgi:hypothetical protein